MSSHRLSSRLLPAHLLQVTGFLSSYRISPDEVYRSLSPGSYFFLLPFLFTFSTYFAMLFIKRATLQYLLTFLPSPPVVISKY